MKTTPKRGLGLLFAAAAALSAGCGGSDDDSGSASACFPAATARAGATYLLNYEVSGARTGTSSASGTVSQGSFNGVDNLSVQQETITTNYSAPALEAGLRTIHLATYLSYDGDDILLHGSERTAAEAGAGSVTTRIAYTPPGRDKRFSLDEGATHSYSTTAATTITPPGSPTTTDTVSAHTTYAGQESVTVPAGTFTACKFQTNAGGNTTTEWIIRGKGISARTVSPTVFGEVVMQLQASSRLNGAPL